MQYEESHLPVEVKQYGKKRIAKYCNTDDPYYTWYVLQYSVNDILRIWPLVVIFIVV